MYQHLPIRDVYAREILDSRGNPTIEVEVLQPQHAQYSRRNNYHRR